MQVALMTRCPRSEGNFSVELMVEVLLKHLSSEFQPTKKASRFESNGVLPRVYNIMEAALQQGDINHIVGDVHFLSYLLKRRRTVLTVLDCGSISGDLDLRKRVLRLLWFQIPVRRCAAITVISNAVKEDLLRHVNVDPGKIRVVPVSVPSEYTYAPKVFDPERPVILQVGTATNKNLPRLIEALDGIPCRLEVVGRLSEGVRALLAKHKIHYGNAVAISNEEMLAKYQACDLVAFASTFEGFGMPIIEGNLVGRPVVTSNVTSMPEVAGNAACIVNPFDVASIRAGILRVINDAPYREQLVQNGFENAKRYTAEAISRQYEEVYRQVAAALP